MVSCDSMHSKPISINWTITTRCNYHCEYCFARFPELFGQRLLPFREMKRIPSLLSDAGCEKLTFVGGEPMLCEHLPGLLTSAKNAGMTTMLVTNGTLLTDRFLQENRNNLDWVSLSIDSQFEDVQRKLGRGATDGSSSSRSGSGSNGSSEHVRQTIENAISIHESGIRLKINSVITKLNYMEDMCDFISDLSPERWKVFQVLKIEGQNEKTVEPLLITNDEFEIFRKNHEHLVPKGLNVVFENNGLMKGSYLMLDPSGRFFTNRNGRHEYGPSIFDVGVESAIRQVGWDTEKFARRGGLYEWGWRRDCGVCVRV